MDQLPLLAADIGEIIAKGFPLVVMILWVLVQVFSGREKKQPKPQRRVDPNQPQQPLGDDLRSEVDAFLREAAAGERPQQREAMAVPEAPAVVEAEVVVTPRVTERRAVASHVSQHLDTSATDERISHLGEVAGHADERIEAQLTAKFDHQLGSFAKSVSQAGDLAYEIKESQRSVANEIAAAFANPADIRRAIIISEILKRPTDRW